jgi:signal transduction histidine kinase
MGLGLAIVRRIVESWGGTVTADSREGEGTVISIQVAVWQDEDTDWAPREEEDRSTGRAEETDP